MPTRRRESTPTNVLEVSEATREDHASATDPAASSSATMGQPVEARREK